MTRILVINPNTTAGMTDKIAVAARQAAGAQTEIVALTSPRGPRSIEGYFDEATSLYGLMQCIHNSSGFDAVVVACFDDTGLDAARCLTDKPVIGIGEAAYKMVSLLCNKFSVVTTLARSVPALEHNLRRYGLDHQCVRVRSSEVAVLDFEHADSTACNKIEAEIALAIEEDKAEAIIRLGIDENTADLLDQLTTAQVLRIAANDVPMCSIRFEDPAVWKLLCDHGKERAISGMHAAILMAGRSAQIAA